MKRRAKIVATIGPATSNPKILRKLLDAEIDVARLNFSHGTHAEHERVYHDLRRLSTEMDKPISIMADVQGPKIRVGALKDGRIILEPGQLVTLTTETIIGHTGLIPVDFPGLSALAKTGSRILLDDGNLELQVVDTNPDSTGKHVQARVVLGGELRPHKGVNLPGMQLDISALTLKDVDDLVFAVKLGVDALAVSFVRSAADIEQVQQTISSLVPDQRPPLIIAKLERPEALEHLDAIVEKSDGVMVARGDLGVEISPEKVPILQKQIIELANKKSKLVITATQMLESMISKPRPTRAEASDVANAIFDGTDALMLSGETAVGNYPVQTVQMMSSIVEQAESHIALWGRWKGISESSALDDDTNFVTRAAAELAHDTNVAGLAAFTESGRTALLLSKLRPLVPILACTSDDLTFRRLNLYWGVEPISVPRVNNIDEMIVAVERAIVQRYSLISGQQLIFTFGYPVQKGRSSNMAYLHTIGE